MPKAMFDQLVENIQRSGVVDETPVLAVVDTVTYIISGHHRIRAARKAGLKYLLAYLYEGLTWDEIYSRVLSHNSIRGTMDPELIKRVWDKIADVQARFQAFIDPRLFDNIPRPVSFKPVDVDMTNTAKTVLIVFLPTQKLDFDAAIEALLPKTEVDTVYLANKETYDGWKAALQRVRSDLNIVNAPTALAEMARLAMEQLGDG